MVFPEVELVVDMETQEIFYKGKRIQLTGKMYEVLLLLARGAPRVVTYNDLTMQIWGETSLPVRNRLKYLVYLLRQEMEKVDSEHPIIKNVDRLGYKLLTEI
jgi:DNA-binding response OmpR family regulator